MNFNSLFGKYGVSAIDLLSCNLLFLKFHSVAGAFETFQMPFQDNSSAVGISPSFAVMANLKDLFCFLALSLSIHLHKSPASSVADFLFLMKLKAF